MPAELQLKQGAMAQPAEKAEQASLIQEVPAAEPSQGPVASPLALLHSSGSAGKRTAGKTRSRGNPSGEEQLALPLDPEPEPSPAEPGSGEASPARPRRGRRGRPGFVPVTRDPDVARSYSDNAAHDNAIAEGLARALASLPPEELAALRAKLARGMRQEEGSTGS